MAAAPWYLLAAGIGLVILGYMVTGLGGRGSGRDFIHPKMSDKEIARRMQESGGSPLGGGLMVTGFIAVLVSIVWRLARVFIAV
jgi:hypothetical protein